MEKTDSTNSKIIILYILSKVDDISSSQLMDCALESLYMDFFSYSQAKSELLSKKLMTEMVRKGELRKDAAGKPVLSCYLTPAGKEILDRLLPSVPPAIRAYLTSASRNWQHDTNESQSVYAEYAPNDEGTWYVDLRLIERGSTTFALRMAAPSEEVAERTCKRWEEATAETYMEILRLLSEEA
jgi:hypothetical protein